jgi:aflatoxin B1 aldehyde reductase
MHHSPLGKDDGFILGASSEQQIDRSLSATEKGPLPENLAQAWEGMWTESKSSLFVKL